MTDVVMPEMNGRALVKSLTPIYSNLRSLFMSGYTANVIAHQGVLDPDVHFLQKPFSMTDLANKIREVIETGLEAFHPAYPGPNLTVTSFCNLLKPY